MATISIGNLNSIGGDLLLDDQESYLDNLSDELTVGVKGGFTPLTLAASPQIGAAAVATFIASAALSYNITKTFGK
jgi:hypothetical protein